MSDIPYARSLLARVRRQLLDKEEFDLADEVWEALTRMHRDPPVRKTAAVSNPVTVSTRDRIKRYAERFPDKPMQAIADFYCMNIGRVSEILNGKWDHL